MYAVANIPWTKCLIRKEFLTRFRERGYSEALLIAVKSIESHGLMFQAFITDQAAVYDKLPIESIVFPEFERQSMKTYDGNQLEIWDNPSYYIAVIENAFLKDAEITAMMPDKLIDGIYLFTIDFVHSNPNELNVNFSENWEEHKSKNIIRLQNGQLAALPNNRMRVVDNSLSKEGSLEADVYLRTAMNMRYVRENKSADLLGDVDHFNYKK